MFPLIFVFKTKSYYFWLLFNFFEKICFWFLGLKLCGSPLQIDWYKVRLEHRAALVAKKKEAYYTNLFQQADTLFIFTRFRVSPTNRFRVLSPLVSYIHLVSGFITNQSEYKKSSPLVVLSKLGHPKLVLPCKLT